ncbi:unnamed protein product [Phaeothamnion confervicola]
MQGASIRKPIAEYLKRKADLGGVPPSFVPALMDADASPDWDELDKPKFFTLGLFMFLGVRATLHPAFVLKTLVQTRYPNEGSISLGRKIIRAEGVRGLYKGFWISSSSLIFRQVYFSVYEMGRLRLGPGTPVFEALGPAKGELVRNMTAGAAASTVMQVCTVPLDIVTQRLMVASLPELAAMGSPIAAAGAATTSDVAAAAARGAATTAAGAARESAVAGIAATAASSVSVSSSGGASSSCAGSNSSKGVANAGAGAVRIVGNAAPYFSAPPPRPPPVSVPKLVRDIYSEGGILSFYRGFGLAVAQFAPTSAVWWGSYGVYQKPLRLAADAIGMEQGPANVVSQGAAGFLAGATTVLLTNPLDVIRTRVGDLGEIFSVCFASWLLFPAVRFLLGIVLPAGEYSRLGCTFRLEKADVGSLLFSRRFLSSVLGVDQRVSPRAFSFQHSVKGLKGLSSVQTNNHLELRSSSTLIA